jgi:hypothetical protein
MTDYEIQGLFGKEPAKIYSYNGSLSSENPIEEITLDFARAANTNLVDAVVTQVGGTWIVYTRNTTVTDDNFTLFLELPLEEPVIPISEITEESSNPPEEE